MKIGEKIKYYREAMQITQDDLAEKVGTSPQNIYKYEKGIITNIPITRVEKMAEIFGVSPAALIGWEEEKPTAGQGDGPKERVHKLISEKEGRFAAALF